MKNARMALAGLCVSGCIGLIASFEGFSNTAYIPVKADVATIGYGQTYYLDGRRVKLGDFISKEKAEFELSGLVKRDFFDKIAQCIKVPLKQNELDAYLSLSYNIGTKAFCNSTLLKKLNKGDYNGACSEILRWNRAGGRVLRGLQLRRFKEYEICLKG